MKHKLKKVKKGVVKKSDDTVEEAEGYPKVQIEEMYVPNKELERVIGAIKDISH